MSNKKNVVAIKQLLEDLPKDANEIIQFSHAVHDDWFDVVEDRMEEIVDANSLEDLNFKEDIPDYFTFVDRKKKKSSGGRQLFPFQDTREHLHSGTSTSKNGSIEKFGNRQKSAMKSPIPSRPPSTRTQNIKENEEVASGSSSVIPLKQARSSLKRNFWEAKGAPSKETRSIKSNKAVTSGSSNKGLPPQPVARSLRKRPVRDMKPATNSSIKEKPPPAKKTRTQANLAERRAKLEENKKQEERIKNMKDLKQKLEKENGEKLRSIEAKKGINSGMKLAVKEPELNKTFVAHPGFNRNEARDIHASVSGYKAPKALTEKKAPEMPASLSYKALKVLPENKVQCVSSIQIACASTSGPKVPFSLPAASVSPESYDISDIDDSDSETEDIDDRRHDKIIPSWASGNRLKQALIQQFHGTFDTDAIFGTDFSSICLEEIFRGTKKYTTRTSSAIWDTTFSE